MGYDILRLLGSARVLSTDAFVLITQGPTMFHVYENAEDVDEIDRLRTVSQHPGVHSYTFVEIPLNTHLFHVDVAPVADQSRWQRFVFDGVENIFAFAAFEKIQEFRIHVQTRRKNKWDYQLKRVIEIARGVASNGEVAYVFSCSDGSIEIGSLNDLSQADIVRTSSLWVEPDINV
ncbi:hypothetical protein [Massilia putida]|uniref:hypothetical protein n=1 Tax=Massilia putida TaxID=1141883 RepID=UPI0012EBDCE4|nr:hypothetical protein [Massilia putida]